MVLSLALLVKWPCFVLSYSVPEKAGEVFTFVGDGIESAVKQAKAAAGDKNVGVMGATTQTRSRA
jgi:hypothetical protein